MAGLRSLCYPGIKDPDPKGFSQMKLLVERLSTTPTELAFDADAAWWEAVAREPDALEPQLCGEAHFALSAQKLGEELYLEGQARAEFECTCSRCLVRYRHALREPFRIVLEPAAERVPSDPEGADALARFGLWLGDELDAGWYRGTEIDLTGFLQEVMVLALPVQPLCRADCRGLCPQCGTDRNTGRCDCREMRSDSPFAVLRGVVTERGD
jgi:uncharacterized protein